MIEGDEHCRVSRINLIDLAGSERSAVSLTSGERLKEGASINKSLHTLGKVISLLSEKSTGKRKKVYIPYRDSTLTWLLKESLGGNSKTAMIATISPADLHHDESLSTLRYAQQARSIVNIARINEDHSSRLIRELRQEIEWLKTQLGFEGDIHSILRSHEEVQQLKEKLNEYEKLMKEMTISWEERLRKTEERKREEADQLKKAGVSFKVDNRQPNLVNLNDDPQLSEMLLYVLKQGDTSVGRSPQCDIQLTAPLVAKDHWYS
jgi:kinesin family protein 14